MMIKKQSLRNQLGEVLFRKKLVEQHKGEKYYFSGVPNRKEIIKVLKERVKNTKDDLSFVSRHKVNLSPFLEIGAEKCQRAMLLANDYNADGFATDISLHSLVSAKKFLKPLRFRKIPKRICCDAYHLPFLPQSFPFVFCYETLHHFPDPAPIISELYRVTRSDGVLFFKEEPVRQLFNLNLWRRDYHLNSLEKILKLMLVLPFLSTIGKSEVEHGILEESFWLDVWEKALAPYEKVEATLQPIFFGPRATVYKNTKKRGWMKPNIITKFLLALQGGGIEAICKVKKNPKLDNTSEDIYELLACPSCKGHKKLIRGAGGFYCKACGSNYKFYKDVLVLLPKEEEKKLYGKTL